MYNEIRPFYFAQFFYLLTSRIECDTLFLSVNIQTVKLLYSLMLLYYQETRYFTILRYPEFTFISLLRKSTTLVYIKLGGQTTLKFTFQCSHFIFMSLLVCLSFMELLPCGPRILAIHISPNFFIFKMKITTISLGKLA